MEIGFRLTKYREDKGYSRNKLAAEVGVTQGFISQVELGNRLPTLEVLNKICNTLEISLSEFFSEASDSMKIVPPDISQFSSDKSNHTLIRKIQDMKKRGYSNEAIQELLGAMDQSLREIAIKYGAAPGKVVWAGDNPTEEDKKLVENLQKKLDEINKS